MERIGISASGLPVISQIIRNSSGSVVGTGLTCWSTFLYFFFLGLGRVTSKMPVGWK